MSCILYNLASFQALAARPTFSALWRDLFASTYYDSPEAFAAALFELNARAFCDRYGEDIETSEEVAAARTAPAETVFSEYIKADTSTLAPLALAKLWETFKRIEYQCSDAHDAQGIDSLWHLGWAKDWTARALCKYTAQQYETKRAA